MKEFEELFTVDDIAQMTMLTSRTIRNYLKDGLLTGRKIGGQWRFTKKDIENLFSNSVVEEEIKDNRRQEVMDFINGVNTDIDGDIQLCTIADYYCNDKKTALTLSRRFSEVITEQTAPATHRFNYEFIEKEQKARYTFFGTPMYIKAAVSILEEEWNHLNESQLKYLGKAKAYADCRPSYHDEAVNLILSYNRSKKAVVADIGSGTGKLSGLLLKKDAVVYAIEPNEDMRREAELQFSTNKYFHSVNATAENTGLRKNSIDLITCAQSFHWFDHENTFLEFKRILKNDGYVFLLWNTNGENPYNQEYWEIIQSRFQKNVPSSATVSNEEAATHLFGAGNYRKAVFENSMLQSLDHWIGGALSGSFSPKEEDEDYIPYVEEFRKLFDKYSQNGVINYVYKTECYYGKLD